MIKLSQTLRLQTRTLPEPKTVPQRRAQLNNGFEHLMMPHCVTLHVPSVRKSSNLHGQKMFKIGSGKTQSKWVLEYTTLAAMRK